MDDLSLLIDLHLRNHRQAPGGDAETRRAIELTRLDTNTPLAVADIGCGTGASTLVLARTLNAHITAIDAAPPFIHRLNERAAEAGLSDTITAQVGDMTDLPFGDHAIDLIWSEGAIYNMGFHEGVRAWRRHLRPGGVLGVSELTWTTASRPKAVEAHWTAEYPGITTVSKNIATLEAEGYAPLGFFFLPPHCWEANYHAPARAGYDAFLDRHAHGETAKAVVAADSAESQLHREHGQWYGYAFYIARTCD